MRPALFFRQWWTFSLRFPFKNDAPLLRVHPNVECNLHLRLCVKSVQENALQLNADPNASSLVQEDLLNFGFPHNTVETIFEKCPAIKNIERKSLELVLSSWLNCQFGEKKLLSLLSNHPYLILLNHRDIERVFMKLSSIFTNEYTYKVLFNAPSVCKEKWENVQEKLDYLIQILKISKAEVVNSGALSYDLHYIRKRITFLTRAGKFRIQESDCTLSNSKKNLRLDIILNTNATTFAEKVANLSIFEYEVFEELYDGDSDDEL